MPRGIKTGWDDGTYDKASHHYYRSKVHPFTLYFTYYRSKVHPFNLILHSVSVCIQ